MRHIKHFLAILLVLCSTVASAHDFVVGGIYYNITDATAKTVEVTYSGSSPSSVSNEYTGAVTIPSTVTYNGATYSVTSIKNFAFEGCTALTGVTIPNSVTSIGNRAFRDCTGLTSATIGNGVTSINALVFDGCTGLTSVTIGSGVTSIGNYAFRDCTGLTAVHINDLAAWCRIDFSSDSSNPLSYAHNLYLNGEKVTDLVIPSDITEIKKNAFRGCTGLNSVTIPNSVTSIGSYAFSGCTGLTRIIIPNSVTSIGGGAFDYCSGLKTVYNLSLLNISKGSTNNGYVAYYADKVINAPNGSIEGYFVFGIIDGVNTLCGYIGNGGDVTLPENYKGENYVIGSNIFKDNTRITGITISDGVTSIGDSTFSGCTGLTGVTIGNSVTSIGNSAFNACTALASVTIGNSVTSIGDNAFQGCTGLTRIIINSGSIGNYAFDGCTKLASVTIGNSVTSIGDYAFSGCIGLASVTIGNSVTSIGDYAFSGCTGLASVTIGNSVTSIGDNAFEGCSGLTSITIPNSVTSIGDYAFSGCTGLASVTIGNSVTSIGDNAFEGCTGLTRIIINSGSIGNYAFDGCTKLASVTIGNSVTSIGNYAFRDCTGLTGVTIGNSVTSIGDYAFDGCTKLASVTIGNSVTSIGDRAFQGCSGLTRIIINSGSIGNYAFDGCTKLASVTIGNSVTSIGDRAFQGCSGLTSITIPNSVKSIGYDAFRGCTGLKTVYNCSSLNIVAGSTYNGYVAYYADKVINAPNGSIEGDFAFSIKDGVNTLVEYLGNGGDVTLPENYNGENYVIGSNIFKDNTTITSVTIPAGVTAIGYEVFSGCTGLTGIVIPNSVTSIENYAFSGCTGLASVTIGDGVTSIGSYAFYNCTGLTAVHINDLAAWCRIDFSSDYSNPLSYAHNLYLNGEKVTDLVIPDGVTEIKKYAFRRCTGLTSITIPNSVTSIGNSAFYGCTGLNGIVIPNSVTSIGNSAFYGCTGLTGITIPNSVTSIGGNAFYGCENLRTVTNNSSLNIVLGSTENGYVAYYADKVINAPNGSVEGDFVFGIIDGINTLVEYIGYGGDVTLPADYKSGNYVIGDRAFYYCYNLRSIEIPNSVTSIGVWAFRGCSGLTSVTIGNGVTSIGGDAFYVCRDLKTVINHSLLNISKGSTENGYVAYYADKVINAPNGSVEGDFVFGIIDGVNTLCGYIGNGGDITLPENYKGENYVIGRNIFEDNTTITGVTIPNSVTSIGESAFSNCTGLTRIIINSGSIGNYAFSGCTKLANVTIGNSVTSIGDYAFQGCTSLTSVTNGNSVTSIGSYAFEGCSSLTAVHISDLAAWCRIDFSNYSSNPLSYAHNLYLNGEKVTDLVIPSDITEIKKYTFYDCSGLTSVTIPNSVTSIGNYAFEGCSGLASVTIGDGVTDIGIYAFRGCTGLTSVTIGNSVTSIGSSAFYGCSGLTSVTIPNSVTSIGNSAFSGCSGLTSVAIGNSVTDIYSSAFRYCENLKTVYNCSSLNIVVGSTYNGYVAYYAYKIINAPNGSVEGDFVFDIIDGVNTLCGYVGNGGDVTLPENYNGENYVIGSSVFEDCTGLTSIEIPNSVTSIGKSAFRDCTGLTSVTIGNSVTSIGELAFQGCTGLTSVTIGNSVTSIGEMAFQGCSGLTSVTIGNSVTSIGELAFQGCTGLTSVTIGNSVTSIGNRAFQGCSGLTSVTIPNSVTSIGYEAFDDCSSLTSVTISDGVTSIGYEAFSGCSSLTSITIPNSVTSINWGAFSGCTGLTSVTIPNSVTSINWGAFSGCTGLTSVTIPNSVTSIESNAFYGCSGLTSITIPNSVTSIGEGAFQGCENLKTVTNNSQLDIVAGSTDNGYVAYYADKVINADGSSNVVIGDYKFTSTPYYGVNTLVEYLGDGGDITLPESYNGRNYVIGADVFKDNTTITSVTISNRVTSIYSNAFYGCSGLTSVTIPNSVTSIGNSAFYGCSGLTSVTIGNSVTSIGSSAFYGCSGLTSVTIPNSVTSIGNSAFYGCSGLTSVTIPNSVTSIGNSAFYGCSGLTSVTIPNRVPSIYSNAFYGCSGLTSVTIGNSVTSIGSSAFRSCYNLTSVTIPNSVTSIGDDAFEDCTGLTAVHINDLAAWCRIYFSNDSSNPLYYAHNLYLNGEKVTDLVIPSDITEIKQYAFFGCSGLTSVTIPNSVTSIGVWAFYGCENLKTVTNNSSLNIVKGSTDNGYVAYYADEVITINADGSSNGVIGDYKFTSANGVNTLVKYLGNSKLDSWTSTNAGVNSSTSGITWTINAQAGDILTFDWRVSSESGYDKLIVTIDGSEILNKSGERSGNYTHTFESAGTYTFVAQYTKDGSTHAGDDCASISNVKIASNGNASIALVLPENYNGENYVIGADVFRDNTAITSIVIPNSVTGIGDNAFYGCSGLKTVINNSSLNIVLGSTDNGYVAYYADKVINADGSSTSIIGDYKFTSANGVNTLVEYLGNSKEITLDSWTSTNAGVDSSTSENTWTINAQAGDILTFDWRVSSESGYDKLIVTIDGSEILNESGEDSGNYTHTFENAGTYTLVAQYTKDGSAHGGDDCASISNVKIASNGNASIALVLPENYNGENYVIGADVFQDNTAITGVTIPAGVTAIGDNAFYGCSGLKTVINNSSLNIVAGSTDNGYVAYYADEVINADGSSTSIIGDYKFTTANGVNTLVEYLGDGGDITLPENYNGENYVIGSSVFMDNTAITGITIPAGVTAIGDNAFYGCENLKTVTNNSSLNIVAGSTDNGYVAYYADKVINADGSSTSIIGDYKFTSYNGVNTLVEYLGDGGDITLPESCNGENYVIGSSVFRDNTAITGVTIPNGVTGIGSYAFYYCRGLTAVHINDLAAWCRIDFSDYYSNPLYYAHNLYLNGELVTDLVIPDGITEIKQYAFYDCTGLTGIEIPNSVTSIGNHAFRGCDGLASVIIGDGVTDIGIYAFYDCDVLTSVTIGNGVTSIGESAFSGCSSLTSVTIPAAVTSIGSNAFYGCENLKTVYNNSSLNIVAGSTDNGYVAYYADKVITPPSISYTSLPAYFNTDNGLPGTIEGNNHIWESETMYFETPKSGIRITVFDINEGEYYNNLPMVALGELEFYDADGNKINYTASDVTTNSLESKEGSLAGLCDGDYSTFYHSTWSGNGTTPTDYVYLDVKFPQAVDAVSIKIVGRDSKRIVPTSIGITENGEYCEISAPTNGTCGESTTWSYNDGVLTISGSGAVTDKGWNKYINNIIGVVIEEGITSIMDDAFLRYSNLTSATLPGTLAVLPQGVFSRTGLTGIEIPEGVTTLGMWAFDNCPALATVTLPTTLTSISDYAFENCTALASVTSNAVIAPTLGANVFGGIAEGATLTYPQGSDYSSWSDYFTISLFTPGDINGDSEVNVGDFASLVNLIFNSDNIDAATMAVADINGDGEVNVGDFAGLVNLIFNSGSQAAPKRAAALATTVEPSLYIEPFSIAPGEQKQIEVLLDNPGEKFSQLQFDLALPEGVEIVFDEDNFCYTIDRGSRLASVYNIDAQDVNGGVKVLALTTNPKAYIKGESGDVVLITVQAADDIADGVYDLSIDNVVLSHQDGSTVKATSTTAAITVSSTTGITNIEGAEGSDVYYDLQGRVVKEPSNGFYIVNGKKVFIK